MIGFSRNSEARMLAIGAEVLAARLAEPPVPWKTLEKRFKRSRAVLARYAAEAAKKTAAEKDVSDVSYDTSYPSRELKQA